MNNFTETQWVLAAKGLGKHYQMAKNQLEVLHDIHLQLAKGEHVAIVGASGSGKSTLLHLLGGLDMPSQGEVFLLGQKFNTLSATQRGKLRNQALGFIYQFHHLLFEFNTLENVAMPLYIRRIPKREADQRATAILEKVGLSERLEHMPSELSGGERQRAAIARALVTEPACVLADEPTGNLDRKTADTVFELMMELNQQLQTSFIIVTHDENLAKRTGKILHLSDGRLS